MTLLSDRLPGRDDNPNRMCSWLQQRFSQPCGKIRVNAPRDLNRVRLSIQSKIQHSLPFAQRSKNMRPISIYLSIRTLEPQSRCALHRVTRRHQAGLASSTGLSNRALSMIGSDAAKNKSSL